MRRIAILGGGVGAMTAAYELTSRPDWRDEYEITVYQMGWRLGGKGASGRNARFGQRIEEHGLHIWMGFYDNAFRTMQSCYAELGRPHGAPLATWQDAFKPSSRIVLNEFVDGRWVEWPLTIPLNSGVPGEGGELPTPRQFLEMIVQWVIEMAVGPRHEAGLEALLEKLRADPGGLPKAAAPGEGAHPGRAGLGAWLTEHLHHARELLAGGPGASAAPGPESHDRLLELLDGFLERMKKTIERWVERHDDLRRMFILCDLGIAAARGVIRDGILEHGFIAADGRDFRAWLAEHGAAEMTLASAPVRELYDLCFAYENGELERPNLAAGTALEIAVRIAFCYQGAVMWKMQAGMGDVVFGPLYQVLERRGVRFEFFQRVSGLELAPDGARIGAIEIERQADLAPGVERYEPLVDVRGLPCWPSEPHYEQLAQGEELERRGVDLESRWSGWKPVGHRRLELDRDFDDVVLGISLGALGELCAELIDAEPAWRTMVDAVGTVETNAVQLWLDPTIGELGRRDEGVVAGTYAEPLDTWADMSELLRHEDWGEENPPRTIVYLCGPKRGVECPPPERTEFPAEQKSAFALLAETWLSSNPGRILPDGGGVGNRAGLDWGKLHVVEPAHGRQRLAQQYLRINIDPSERYVLSLAGSTEARLPASDRRFRNLFLAGDWVRTGLNAGCVEAAVMAGLAAAEGVMRKPVKITGWANRETSAVAPGGDPGGADD